MEGNESFFIVIPILFIATAIGAITTIILILKKKNSNQPDPPPIS